MRLKHVLLVITLGAIFLFEPATLHAQPTASPAPTATPPTIVWCSGLLGRSVEPINSEERTFQEATTALCQGKFAVARDRFASIVSYRIWIGDGSWWPNAHRGYFYSLIAARDDVKARTLLTQMEAFQQPQWRAHPADRLFWNGSPQAAFKAYAAESGSLEGPPDPDEPRDPNILEAAQTNGDWDAAIALLLKPSGTSGASTAKSEQLLMLGLAYEQQSRWRDAFTAWVRAADSGHQVPESDFIDEWNYSALEMIYYYRAHIPSDQRT